MNFHIKLISLLIALNLALSCGSSKEELKPLAKLPSQIPMNRCRLVGVIVAIDTARYGKGSEPCAKAPCRATVKVSKIIGFGPSFTSSINEGDMLDMDFVFTLSPTTPQLFPDLTKRYGGLSVGDSFQSDVESSLKFGMNQSFAVFDYEKLMP